MQKCKGSVIVKLTIGNVTGNNAGNVTKKRIKGFSAFAAGLKDSRIKRRKMNMNHNVYLYILVMAGVTYLIRLLPLTLIKKEIKNVYVKSFLYYVPYVTLSVMTFPAILHATASVWSGAAALAVAVLLAWKGKSLFQVSLAACAMVFLLELFL